MSKEFFFRRITSMSFSSKTVLGPYEYHKLKFCKPFYNQSNKYDFIKVKCKPTRLFNRGLVYSHNK